MRLSALRLDNVGQFGDAVTIEGFSDGLNVLAGPNEAGKSTLLRALRAVFLEKHGADNRQTKELRPYAGGDPSIEADFTASGRSWRIAKRFGRGKSAELRDLTGGTVLKGIDAEQRLAELLGQRGAPDSSAGLVWVAQGAALTPVAPDEKKGERALLVAAIRDEIEAAAGGNAARTIQRQVISQLEPMIGGRPRGQPKTGSALDRALKRRAELRARLDAARDTAAIANARLDELGRLRARLDELADPDRRGGLERAREAAMQHLDTGRQSAGRLRTAEAKVRAAEAEAAAAKLALSTFEARLGELDRIVPERERLSADETRLAMEATTAAERLVRADTALAEAQSGRMRAADEAEAAAGAARLTELAGRLATGRSIVAEIAALERKLAASPVTDALIERMAVEARAIDMLHARLEAEAPVARLDLLPDARAKVTVDGRPVTPGTELRITAPVEIAIAGIGRIVIAPGGGEARAETEADLTAHRETLDGLLAGAHVASMEEARALGRERQSDAAHLRDLKAQLSGIAAKGIAALEAEHAALARRRPDTADASATVDLVTVRERIEAMDRQIRSLADARRDAQATSDAALAGASRASAATAAAVARIDALQAELPPAAERTERLEQLTAAARQAQTSLNEALRERVALAETTPDAAALGRLETDGAAATAALRRAESERHEVERQVSQLEGALSSIAEAGGVTAVAELEGEHERQDAEVARIEAERDALQLLSEVLDEAMRDTKDRYLAPVLARLSPYLSLVFPDARLSLDETLAPVTLSRNAVSEPVERLSGGTREQIAVLTRLAYARLLADKGQPMPLVLDDALIATDDARLDRMFAAFATAGAHHQVIVLTCHERAFEPLITRHGGTRLSIRRS